MITSYTTIIASTEYLLKEKASRFIGLAFPVRDEDQCKTILQNLKKKYFDATHICFAYVLNPDKSLWRINDDGEPSGTAGKPILGQINSNELTNVLIAVVRYYGGTKLGTGGLIQAYRDAAAGAIQLSTIRNELIYKSVELVCSYENLSAILRAIKMNNGEMISNEQKEKNRLLIKIPIDLMERFTNDVTRLSDEIKPIEK